MLLGDDVLMLRPIVGEAVAIGNRCPHRFARLDQGTFDGSAVQCPYHGLRFGLDGACRPDEANVRLPVGAGVRSYPLVERWGQLWFWPGDPSRADPNAIADFSCHTDAGRRLVHGHLVMQGNYELLTDNVMDLSHVRHLHGTTLASPPGGHEEFEVRSEGDTLRSKRLVTGAASPPVWAFMSGYADAAVNHWLEMRWDPPSLMLLDVGVAPPDSSRSRGYSVLFSHNLTPERASSTHYFWGCARSFRMDESAIDDLWRQSVEVAFANEDAPMVVAQQEHLGERDLMDARPLVLAGDRAAILCQRKLAHRRAAEVAEQTRAEPAATPETVPTRR